MPLPPSVTIPVDVDVRIGKVFAERPRAVRIAGTARVIVDGSIPMLCTGAGYSLNLDGTGTSYLTCVIPEDDSAEEMPPRLMEGEHDITIAYGPVIVALRGCKFAGMGGLAECGTGRVEETVKFTVAKSHRSRV